MTLLIKEIVSGNLKALFHTKRTRPFTHYLMHNGFKELVGVEIGTAKGVNAYNMLSHLDIKMLYLIDPYVPYVDQFGVKRDYCDCELYAHNLLKHYKDKIVFVRDFSYNVVDMFDDNSLDFVYVDGNLGRENFRSDVLRYYQKVKVGCLIGGNNFCAGYEGVPVILDVFGNDGLMGSLDSWWKVKGLTSGLGEKQE